MIEPAFALMGVVGFGTYVSISSQNPIDFNAARQLGPGPVADLVNALLSGPWIGGLLPEAPELRARGIANGQGDNRFGLHFGGGLEFRVSRTLSFGVDYRANKVEGRNGGPFGSFTFKQGFHAAGLSARFARLAVSRSSRKRNTASGA